jgi:hypothetical protein
MAALDDGLRERGAIVVVVAHRPIGEQFRANR